MYRYLFLVAAVFFPLSVFAQNNSCQYALDNECDEAQFGGGGYCDAGTDATDCAIVATGISDNSCQFANDSECDEPRFFGGTGSCVDGSDANDCESSLTPADYQAALFSALPQDLRAQLGDDSCAYANDTECDDASFGGTGSCEPGSDASDCRAVAIGGDDSCQFALDNECDDPGIGTGQCVQGSDRTDCELLVAGASDNSCQYANDGECDEPRFADTTGACRDGSDANDCAGALTPAQQETASLDAVLALLPESLRESLGSNDCGYANDGECDDAAFNGTGACDAGTDANDCRILAAGGDNSCEYADDNECDEPGIGTGVCVSGSDANDCAAVEFMRNRSDSCSLAFNGSCDEPVSGTGQCRANTDTADCIGRERPAVAEWHFFGRDDRFLPDTTQMPWRTIGQLILPGDGACTATLIGPRLLLTAAHCLTDDGTTLIMPEAFYAGLDDQGYIESANVVAAEFAPDYSTETVPAGQGNGNDWGLVTLDRDIGSSVGYLDVHVLDGNDLTRIRSGGLIVDQAGYSRDTGANLSGHYSCRITGAFPDSSVLHECDTLRGDSGSPFLLRDGDIWEVIALDSQFFETEKENAAFSNANMAVDSRAFAKAVERLRATLSQE